MSFTHDVVTGLTDLAAALPSIPGIPYSDGIVPAALAGAAVFGGWRLAHPARDSAPIPTLRTWKRAPRMPRTDVAPLLDIPLDVIPTDDEKRKPYDVVGPDAIKSVVDQFYSRVLADPILAPLFDGVPMDRLKRHQALFIGQLWGGPVQYPLTKLREAHAHLNISADVYWRVAGYLMVTLRSAGVPDWIAVFTMTRLYQAQELIIDGGRGAKPSTEPGHRPGDDDTDDGGVDVTAADPAVPHGCDGNPCTRQHHHPEVGDAVNL